MGSLPHIVEDCHGLLQLYSDGSIFRSDDITFPAHIHHDPTVIYKDFLFDKSHNLHLRLYKPKSPPTAAAGLPIIIFIHGGGFCFGSRTWPHVHNCCLRLSSFLQAIVVSPDYRLSPEHRLPASMDDGFAALKWVQLQAQGDHGERWVGDGVDFGRVFVVGDSSGGNIAHHLAVRVGSGSPELAPVRVRGYVLLAPFFGGVVRTKSEADGVEESVLNLDLLDRFWRLSIPVGGSVDHPLVNPFGPNSPSLEDVELDPILVVVGGRELMKDRVVDYTRRLKELGKNIEYVEFEGKQHGFFTNEPYSEVGDSVLKVISNFMHDNSST